MLVQCGDPKNADHESLWHEDISENGWFGSPDNGAVDASGRLWIATDQSSKSKYSGTSDGLWVLETEGKYRGLAQMFYRVPLDAELCGPVFSDDGESLFLAIQHPGDIGGSSARVENASTYWPDFDSSMPPRPSIVTIRRIGGGRVG